jgi:amino acid efflux transporter
MSNSPAPALSTTRGAALYVGALFGPSLLLLPGLAASLAGPASILAWVGLLVLSGLFAWVFTRLGIRIPSGGGVAAYATAGLGQRAGRAVGWCFLAGVVFGAPVVCLIGGTYVATLVGGGRLAGVVCAVVLLAVVVAITLGGARAGTTAQLVLVAVLVVLVTVAVVGAAPSARAANWTPFAPHGWSAVGTAGSALMLSFVGWEAIAPLTARLRDPGRQLPRVIGTAFVVTSVVYLALAATTVGVLGDRAGSEVPLADLLRVAVGTPGPVVAALAAVALTLAATNAYLSGAAALLTELRANRPSRACAPTRSLGLQLGIAGTGVLLLGGEAAGVVTTAQSVAVPTALFLVVYLGCTAAAVRVLRGGVRVAAAVSCVAVLGVLALSGWAVLVALVVVVGATATYQPTRVRAALVGHLGA